MRLIQIITIALCAGVTIAAAGFGATRYAFAGRVPLGVTLGAVSLSGIPHEQLTGALAQYQEELAGRTLTLTLRDQTVSHTLAELGITLDVDQTRDRITRAQSLRLTGHTLAPVFTLDARQLAATIESSLADHITPPRNASLEVTPANRLTLVPGASGEGIDLVSFEHEVRWRLANDAWHAPITLALTTTPPAVQDHEVAAAQTLGETLLRDGFTLTFGEEEWLMRNVTIRRLLTFTAQPDPAQPGNHRLGIEFDAAGLIEYLDNTLADVINQPAVNARFERQGDRVEQFAVPQEGRTLNQDETITRVNEALRQGQMRTALAVDVVTPEITEVADIEALGITTLLATGESDFVDSPANRQHNIAVGTSRYHGLLIPPGDEFSFNEHLGPVDASTGFKPELVIKENVTTPEYGGGLCQVSTTAFRAAVYSGLEITNRRNHSYAVRYYGTPGFDATIYPPYTDLRFTNNTPGYILIQARVEGTRVIFEFWGTDDGRTVEVAGPTPYDRKPDGSVKATLTQKVSRDGDTLIDETFYSRYRSPDLFPRVLAADDPARAQNPQSNDPTTTQSPAPQPAPNSTAPAPSPPAGGPAPSGDGAKPAPQPSPAPASTT